MSDAQSIYSGAPMAGQLPLGDSSAQAKTTQKLIKMYEWMKRNREPWDTVYSETCRYVAPRYQNFEMSREKRGEKQTKQIYDTTALTAINTAALGFLGYLTPQNDDDWFRFAMARDEMNRAPGVRKYLQDAQDQMWIEIQRSNFYSALREAYPLVLGPGMTTLHHEADPEEDVTHFTVMHPAEVWVHQDRYGRIDTWVRRLWMTAEQIIGYYDEEKVPQELKRAAVDHPYREYTVLIFVMPRAVRDVTKLDNKNMPWASYHVLEDGQHMLKESGYRHPPFITYALQKSTNEVMGRGWGLDLMPEILRVNQIQRTMLQAAQLAVQPPVLYPSEMRRDLDFEPDAKVPYTDPNRVPFKMDLVGNYPIGKDEIAELQMQIRQGFMYDFWLSLQQLQGDRTATEVLELQGEKAALLGAISGDIQNNLLIPMLSAIYMDATKAGRMPKMPRALLELGGPAMIKVEFIGPLAQMAKRFLANRGVQQTMSAFVPLLEIFPEMRHTIKPQQLARHILREGTFPAEAVASEREVQEALAAEQQMMQAQQQMAATESAGKALPGLAKAKEAGLLPDEGGGQ